MTENIFLTAKCKQLIQVVFFICRSNKICLWAILTSSQSMTCEKSKQNQNSYFHCFPFYLLLAFQSIPHIAYLLSKGFLCSFPFLHQIIYFLNTGAFPIYENMNKKFCSWLHITTQCEGINT